ncbi:hypothetical protein E1301_Tti018820 [Triplophysa tibetana]|uniref:Uncharacterized protein n=1 Tax=Triplophysa tibetana TaxID=1572043 RepID=A0A5A9P3V9_9TELE|nr:hypothetical protein E1301_Tti018820 [Triplophysa tibetana]
MPKELTLTEGETCCRRVLATDWPRGAGEFGQRGRRASASGCPKRWLWETEVHSAATVKASVELRPVLPRPWVEVGWLSSKRRCMPPGERYSETGRPPWEGGSKHSVCSGVGGARLRFEAGE